MSACLALATELTPINTEQPALAATTCDQPLGGYFAGWFSNGSEPHAYGGVAANVVFEPGSLCTGPYQGDNPSVSWTMVNGYNGQGWAQSGYGIDDGWGCYRQFAQQLRQKGVDQPVTKLGACVNPGETHTVWQQSLLSNGIWAIRSNIDGWAVLDSSVSYPGGPPAWSPLNYWTYPFVVEFETETHHDNSDVPGYTSDKTDFSGMSVQDNNTLQWYTTTCGTIVLNWGIDPQHRYATDAPSCNHVRSWTSG